MMYLYSMQEIGNIEISIEIAQNRLEKVRKSKVLTKLLPAMEECLQDKSISVEDVAKRLYITRGHLYKIINERLDCTARQLINDYRFVVAIEQMSDPNNTITQVAYNVGYTSLAHFSYAFKAYFGISPSEYLQKRN